jgi:hypothetical protein
VHQKCTHTQPSHTVPTFTLIRRVTAVQSARWRLPLSSARVQTRSFSDSRQNLRARLRMERPLSSRVKRRPGLRLLHWQRMREARSESLNNIGVERTRLRDSLRERMWPSDKDAPQFKGLREPSPLSIGEANRSMDRHVARTESDSHRVQLPGESVDDLRSVATSDVQPMVDTQPAAHIPPLDYPAVVLGIDHPDAIRGDGEVINIASRLWDATIVQEHGSIPNRNRKGFREFAFSD